MSERVEDDLKLTRLPRTVQPITPSNLFAVAAASRRTAVTYDAREGRPPQVYLRSMTPGAA